MFEIHTNDRDRLKRIATAGAGGIVMGLVLIGYNLVGPLAAGSAVGTTNLVFGLFGVLVLVLATHPTYHAALKLDGSEN